MTKTRLLPKLLAIISQGVNPDAVMAQQLIRGSNSFPLVTPQHEHRSLQNCYPSGVNKIRVSSTTGQVLNMFEFKAYNKAGTEIASGKNATQSSTYIGNTEKFGASNAVDGLSSTFSHTDSGAGDTSPTWTVDLAASFEIGMVSVLNRWCGDTNDAKGCLCRLSDATVELWDSAGTLVQSSSFGNTCSTLKPRLFFNKCHCSAQKLKLESNLGLPIQIFELEAYSSGTNVAHTLGTATQSSTLKNNTIKFGPGNAIDNSESTFSHTDDATAWLQVDLGSTTDISDIVIHNRWCKNSTDPTGCLCRLTSATYSILDSSDNVVTSGTLGNTCGVNTIYKGFTCLVGDTSSPTSSPTSASPTTTPTASPVAVCAVKGVMLEATIGQPIQIFEMEVISSSTGMNVALALNGGSATQSSTFANNTVKFGSGNAIDNSYSTFSHTDDSTAWLNVNLETAQVVEGIIIHNRWCKNSTDPSGCLCRLTSATLTLRDSSGNALNTITLGNTCGVTTVNIPSGQRCQYYRPSTSPSLAESPSPSTSMAPSGSPCNYCPSGFTEYVPISGCSGFIDCKGDGSIYYCPEGLWFDYDLQLCNWIRDVTCTCTAGISSDSPSLAPSESSSLSTSIVSSDSPCNYCPSGFTGYVPILGCSGFYECVNGVGSSMNYCPYGLLFDFDLQNCNWIDLDECTCTAGIPSDSPSHAPSDSPSHAPSESPSQSLAPSGSPCNYCPISFTEYVPNFGCRGFQDCAKGDGVINYCPPGLLFDSDLQLCNWADSVTCKCIDLMP